MFMSPQRRAAMLLASNSSISGALLLFFVALKPVASDFWSGWIIGCCSVSIIGSLVGALLLYKQSQ